MPYNFFTVFVEIPLCYFQFLCVWVEKDESFIHPLFPPLCLLRQTVCETEKSGVKEEENVRWNWRWQLIVGNGKSCIEDVAVGDEVAQCLSNTPNTTSFHLISSFPFTSFLPSSPITSSLLSAPLFSSMYDCVHINCGITNASFIFWKGSLASQWRDGVATQHNTSLSVYGCVFLSVLRACWLKTFRAWDRFPSHNITRKWLLTLCFYPKTSSGFGGG